MINIHCYEVVENEHLYGPGKRLLIFTQGCSLRCNGCINQHLWEFGKGYDVAIDGLIEQCADLEGITLHGGEPLDQAEPLYKLIDVLKNKGKTIVLFTGYTYKELNAIQRRVWLKSDIVVSGRYDETRRDIYLQFRGSRNQKVFTHKGRYCGYKVKDGRSVAVLAFDETGEMHIRGFQNEGLKQLLNDIKIKKP